MSIDEKEILSLFLKNGASFRSIDLQIGENHKKTKGFVSFEIIKKYNLNKFSKRLFSFSSQETKKIIEKILKNPTKAEDILNESIPNITKKYFDCYVTTKSEITFRKAVSGETRNIIRDFYKTVKGESLHCQFHNCTKTDLHTVHFNDSRPELFESAAKESIIGEINGLKIFDYYQTMTKFINNHSKKESICFLCTEHHNEFHRVEKKSKKELALFKKKIRIKKVGTGV